MTNLYSGSPGSYKSYHAVSEILSWLKSKHGVIANFPINLGYFKGKEIGKYTFVSNSDLTVSYLLKYAAENHHPGYKPQTLVVIDEASIMFNSRQFDRKDRMEWINFFANHRHFNFEIILICQHDRMLDRQIRSMVENEYKHRALKNFNLFGRLVSMIFGGLFMVVCVWYPCKMKSSADLMIFRKKKAAVYDTMALFDIQGKEVHLNDDDKGKAETLPATASKAVSVPGSVSDTGGGV